MYDIEVEDVYIRMNLHLIQIRKSKIMPTEFKKIDNYILYQQNAHSFFMNPIILRTSK